MNNIEDIIKSTCKNDIEIPIKIQHRINYTLKNKKKEKHYFRKIITIIISALCTMLGTFGVYAATGGKIEGIPATDWLGIKFSNKYVDYKQPVENQVIAFKDTSVELTSTICNEGITILEFNIKLSKEDYKKLKMEESIISDECLQLMEEEKSGLRDKVIHELKDRIYNEELRKGNSNIDYQEIIVPEEDIKAKYEKELVQIEENIERYKNTALVPALSLNYRQKGGVFNYDKFNPNMEWYASIFIDDVPYFVSDWQKAEKISDYEYKIYTMYSITDDVLEGKEEFKITLKNNKLVSIASDINMGEAAGTLIVNGLQIIFIFKGQEHL